MVTIAFDVDGTLETSNGPVPVARLRELCEAGVNVVIVSPSGARPPGFDERNTHDRLTDLRETARDFPAAVYLYVSDNGDMEYASQAGFTYVDRLLFR